MSNTTSHIIDGKDHPILQRALDEIIDLLCEKTGEMIEVDDWLKFLISETVPHGKFIRGMLFLDTYQTVEKSLTDEKLDLAAMIFWLIEIGQTSGLIMDDVVDRSQTRRGKPCWHLREGVGLTAIYDVFFLEQCIYEVYRQKFNKHAQYAELLDLTHSVCLTTIRGQYLDLIAEQRRLCSSTVYDKITKTKTAYYTFTHPIRAALLFADIDDPKLHRQVDEFSERIGLAYQVQDDYLDCYGDPEVTGKIGTDIVDGKCTWLYVTAMKMANDSQKKRLKQNYGKGKPGEAAESEVKAVYDELELVKHYETYISKCFEDIRNFLAEVKFPFSLDSLVSQVETRRK